VTYREWAKTIDLGSWGRESFLTITFALRQNADILPAAGEIFDAGAMGKAHFFRFVVHGGSRHQRMDGRLDLIRPLTPSMVKTRRP
jgi:hypothetical protein